VSDVFISYARSTEGAAVRAAEALRAQGFSVWRDEQLPAHRPYADVIEERLRGARAVLVLWSAEAAKSEWVRSEADLGRALHTLVQASLDGSVAPMPFDQIQCADLRGWSGQGGHAGWRKVLDSIAELAEREPPPAPPQAQAKAGWRSWARLPARGRPLWLAALAVVALAAAGGGAWWWMQSTAASGPITLAVLPFRDLSAGNASLVDAIWDDTRGALAHNPNLRVLGRTTMTALSGQRLDAAAYRSKVGAAYLLDGGVQRAGDGVQIDLSLVRTADGVEVWADRVGGKLGDAMALEDGIAREVEGRIRGRLAPHSGVKAENIATSGEVYQIFADARARMRRRNHDDMLAAAGLLKQAVTLDPNYAPAWVELGVATRMARPDDLMPDQARAQGVSDIQRALTLAPNLAKAHAALAMVKGEVPSTEGELRRALALDPGDAEAWMWLGNLMGSQNRDAEALAAYDRAQELEPLLLPLVDNRVTALTVLGKKAELDREFRRLEQGAEPRLAAYAHWANARAAGRPAEAARALLDLLARSPSERQVVATRLAPVLLQLGYTDEAAGLMHLPEGVSAIWRGQAETPRQLAVMDRPLDFWVDGEFPMIYARLLPKDGRLQELIGYYRAAFHNPDELLAAMDVPVRFMTLAPNLAVDLRRAGDDREASLMIAKAESLITPLQANGPLRGVALVWLAQIRGAEGRGEEALSLLRQAVEQGWLPDRTFSATDIADEPAYAALLADPRFQTLRKRILDRIAEERRKLGAISIQ
jgi:adenylate cyclase